MKMLVTGQNGQVARSIAEWAPQSARTTFIFAARPVVDLVEPGSLARAIEHSNPDIVLNAAAYTDVDRSEDNAPLAFRINADAAGEGAEAAAHLGIPFLQLSTDYVFDGSGVVAWRECDPVGPLNIYGRSKAEGEKRVLAASRRHLVVRTSWVVSPFGQNFVKKMLALAAGRHEIPVVADQRGCPTSALELAGPLVALATMAIEEKIAGVWHLAGQGAASWAELAQCVMESSAVNGGPTASIRPIATADFPTAAKRPANSMLDCRKAREMLGIGLPDWQAGVDDIVQRLVCSR
jgi:dTDP-4-dehydrorhamnose reductase